LSKEPTLILASTSPRRRQLLSLTGWEFDVIPADIDETPLPGESPGDYVLRLAREKASSVASRARNGRVVIAADTTVVDGERMLGKPGDAREATSMLESLRGRTHQVLTGIAVYRPGSSTLLQDCAVTDVPMRDYSDEEMQVYIESGDPFDKAGGYAIQHAGFNPVAGLTGCHANVVGLPLCHVLRTLQNMNIFSSVDTPSACQNALEYACPVYQEVLRGDK